MLLRDIWVLSSIGAMGIQAEQNSNGLRRRRYIVVDIVSHCRIK